MSGRFPLYTDTDIDGPVVKALRAAAWDILRGIDAFPEKTRDHVHFARAAQEGRVLVSNDIDMKAIARSHYAVMSPGDFKPKH